MLRLHDTVSSQVVDLGAAPGGRFSMYVCGPTVDNLPHIGHGRTLLIYDVLRRYLESCQVVVEHVSNVTDIDDKIIKRARDTGRPWEDVAHQYEAEWWSAADGLGVARPHRTPHATEYVKDMVELVGELVGAANAYELDDGVYFSTAAVADYGLLAQQPLESLRAGARVEAVAGKRSPLDFVLWKRSKPDEPSWPSPWGAGRPGWHTECVVMSLDLLGEGFDLHTGGLDLKFPHHENERAQAVALGRDFARHWMHHAFVEVEGEKMSKSLGNFTSLSDLLSREDGRAYRLLVLQSHYRSPIEVTPDTVTRARVSLERLDVLASRFPGVFDEGIPPAPAAPPAAAAPAAGADALARFRAAMEDDLDTPGAVSVLFDTLRSANAAGDAGRPDEAGALAGAVRAMAEVVGLAARPQRDESLPPAVTDLVARLDGARADRDFATADAVRAELAGLGWSVETGPSGSRVRRRDR